MLETDQTRSFRRIAEILRSTQRAAIEVENAPDKRKRLRSFSIQETASILGIRPRDVSRHIEKLGCQTGTQRNRLNLGEINLIRDKLKTQSKHRQGKGNGNLAVVAFTNFKGGSGKTTSSVHFAQFLARAGYRVLLVDLDSQGSTTAQFGIDPETEVGLENSFAAWINARANGQSVSAAALCQPTYWPGINLVPAGAVLAQAEEALAARAATGRVEPVLYFDELTDFLSQISENYDVAVIDTRPDVNMLMTIALHAASGLVVPTRATMTDLASTGAFFSHLADYVSEFQASFGTALPLTFTKIMITAYDPTDRSQDALATLLRERFGNAVLSGAFLHSKIMGTAGFGKETLYEYEPTTDRTAYNRVISSVNAINMAIEREIVAMWAQGGVRGAVKGAGLDNQPHSAGAPA